LGFVSNNGTTDVDYAASIAQRTSAAPTGTQGAFRNGATTGASFSDFDQSYNPINSYEQGVHFGGPPLEEAVRVAMLSARATPSKALRRASMATARFGTRSPKSMASQGKVCSLWWDWK
jgi:hypothetical protein